MPIEITVPRLGWSMDEGTFGEWLKQAGDAVNAGDMIYVLEGDKASQEIESFDAGLLHIPADAPQPGDTVKVGQVLGFLLADNEPVPSEQRPVSRKEPPTASNAESPLPNVNPIRRAGSRVIATPRARRRARELGVEWSHIRGTGRDGRVRECDVVAIATHLRTADGADQQTNPAGTLQPISTIRRAIAQRMLAGVHQTAPVTLTTKVAAENLVARRAQLQSTHADGIVPSYQDILAKLVASALSACPELNAGWRNEGIFTYDQVNIAIAIDTNQGLVAPVLNNVAALSLEQVARQTRTLIEQARAGQLAQDQLQGGTFTMTNLGMFDIDFFTPIINVPQTAVLGIGRIAAEPVVQDHRVVPGQTMSLSLTFDHRVIDGAPAARWLQQLAQMIEQVGQDQ